MASENALAQESMTVVVIGAYGLLGCGIAQRLQSDGHTVIGLGRDIDTGKRVLPTIRWLSADLRLLTDAHGWAPFLAGVDVVVNCAGALQEGPEDDLEAVHHLAIAALANACSSADVKIIQISAVGAHLDAPTRFLASKARGDAAIQTSGAQHVIFRPGLVLARNGYGGSTMLRMLAAFPWVQPIAIPDSKIQTIGLVDISSAVSAAIANRIPDGFVGDLVESEIHTLRVVVASMRNWLGFSEAEHEIVVPNFVTHSLSRIADGLTLLGWRSPLRSTALGVLDEGITGVPTDLTQFGTPPVRSLEHTLANISASAEDRMFARMSLLTPLIIATLIVFWFSSGVIGLLRANEAAHVLEAVGWPHTIALASVLFWAVVDIAVAVAFAYRPFAKLACWTAVIVSLVYLVASTLFVPGLWLDPLGPLVKIFPGIALAMVARIGLETR